MAIDYPYLNKLVNTDGEPIDPKGGYWQSFPAAGAAEGTYEKAEERLEETANYFANGQLFVLEKLKELNDNTYGIFTKKMDFFRLISAGHSAGALGVKGLMSQEESSFSAFITYDVSIHEVIGARDIIIPHINKTTAPIQIFILEYASAPDYEFLQSLNTDLEIQILNNMHHSSLSDLDYLYYEDEGMVDEVKQTSRNFENIFPRTLEFLDQKMKYSD